MSSSIAAALLDRKRLPEQAIRAAAATDCDDPKCLTVDTSAMACYRVRAPIAMCSQPQTRER